MTLTKEQQELVDALEPFVAKTTGGTMFIISQIVQKHMVLFEQSIREPQVDGAVIKARLNALGKMGV